MANEINWKSTISDRPEWSKEVFAKNLEKYMKQRGITQRDMAAIVGVSAPTVNEWLKAKKYPRIDKIEIMANYFGIMKSDLIEDKSKFQEKNDTIVGIVSRLRTNEEFLSIVKEMSALDSEKLLVIKQVLSAINK